MSKQTFEQSLRTVFSSSQLSRIVEGDYPATWWPEALVADKKAIENVIDDLCEDLSRIINRKVRRFTKLRTEMFLMGALGRQEQAEMTWFKFTKNINHYIKQVIENIRSDPRPANSIIFYPINKIWWERGNVFTTLPDDMGMLQNIKLMNPTQFRCDGIETPAHIRRILEVCETTHFDYQPFVVQSRNGDRILAIRLGDDWHDLAVATWKPVHPIKNLNVVLGGVIAGFVSLFCGGCWASQQIESLWLSLPLWILSTIFGALAGLFTSLLITRLHKSLRV